MTTWNETPAALIRNQGLVVESPAAPDDDERRDAASGFQHVWSSSSWVVQRDDGTSYTVNNRAVMAEQRSLAERGWTGEIINVESSIPPELRPMYLAEAASQTRQATTAAGRKDAEWIRIEAEGQARYEAARAKRDAALGPLARTISFGDPEFGEL